MKVREYEGLIVVTCNQCDDQSHPAGGPPEHATALVKGWPAMMAWLDLHAADKHTGEAGGDFEVQSIERSYVEGNHFIYVDVDPPAWAS